MRYSRQRAAIVEVLRSTKIHPNAEWVYAEVRKKIAHISLGTVYRNLAELTDSGEILTLVFGDTMHFDGCTEPHSHFVCKSCGQISDIEMQSGQKQRLEQQGYTVDGEQLAFFGICPNCATLD